MKVFGATRTGTAVVDCGARYLCSSALPYFFSSALPYLYSSALPYSFSSALSYSFLSALPYLYSSALPYLYLSALPYSFSSALPYLYSSVWARRKLGGPLSGAKCILWPLCKTKLANKNRYRNPYSTTNIKIFEYLRMNNCFACIINISYQG